MGVARGRRRHLSLYAILARDAPRAVIFRRGPSKQVLLLAWNLDDDTFEEGQWLKGRIYERRCDLSPDGRYLLYFAANWKEPYQSWTAISRPPFLTALALWPKGDAWGGGGHFASNKHILLNHRPEHMQLAEDYKLLRSWKVEPLGEHSGRGEDDPIWSSRLLRDGWTRRSNETKRTDRKGRVWVTYDTPVVWEKKHPFADRVLRMSIEGIGERDGSWYLITHEIIDGETRQMTPLGRTDWAEWSRNGDLLHSRETKLYRNGRLLRDFGDLTFVNRRAPESMRRWK
jgi:hypothetical protein